MKKIALHRITPPNKESNYTIDNRYTIHFGFDMIFHFKNEVKAKKFLSDTNLLLNNTVFELNIVYIDIWVVYRKLLLLHYDYFVRDYTVVTKIAEIEKTFALILGRNSWANGNVFTYKWINTVIILLENCIEALCVMLKKKNKYDDINYLKVYDNRLVYIESKLTNWGADLPEKFIDKTKSYAETQATHPKLGLTKKVRK